ncbi:cytochrome P450 [Nocardia sp. NPDC050710]|uniref:cytochrome P450 n=1 Tax=Nocardia sp. NPDC050710 TaxID=3157220 RepID=UPI003402F6DC
MLRHGAGLAFLRPLAQRGDAHARLWFDNRSQTDLFALQDQLRSDTGITRGVGGCVVTSHGMAREILSKPKKFRNLEQSLVLPKWLQSMYRFAASAAYSDPFDYPSMVALEGSRLTEARGMLRGKLSKAGAEDLRPRIEQRAKELAAGLAAAPAGEVDIVSGYSRPLSLGVLALLFDSTPDELRAVCTDAERVSRLIDLGLPLGEFRRMSAIADRIDRWTDRHIAEIDNHPNSAVGPAIAAMRAGKFTLEEVRRMVNLLIAAGYTTTISVISSGIKLLIDNPDQLALLRERPDLWRNATEEILRLAGPVMLIPRYSLIETEYDGQRIKSDRPVYITGVNTDPIEFEDPQVFDIRRANADAHLSFGSGAHLCLGAPLARVEIEAGLRAFFDAHHNASVVSVDPASTTLVRGWDSLVIRLSDTAVSIEK